MLLALFGSCLPILNPADRVYVIGSYTNLITVSICLKQIHTNALPPFQNGDFTVTSDQLNTAKIASRYAPRNSTPMAFEPLQLVTVSKDTLLSESEHSNSTPSSDTRVCDGRAFPLLPVLLCSRIRIS